MDRTHESMSEAAKDVLDNYVLRDDRRVVSRKDKDAFYEVAAGVMAECVIALLDKLKDRDNLKAAANEVIQMECERVNEGGGEPYDPVANPGAFDPRVVALSNLVWQP